MKPRSVALLQILGGKWRCHALHYEIRPHPGDVSVVLEQLYVGIPRVIVLIAEPRDEKRARDLRQQTEMRGEEDLGERGMRRK